MNPFEKFLQTKGYTIATFEGLDEQKQASIQNDYLGSIETQLESLKGQSAEIEVLKTQISEMQTKGATAEQITALNNEIMNLKENPTRGGKGIELVKEIKDNKETLKDLAKGGKGEIELKALTTRASVDPNLNYNALDTIGQLGVKRRALYDVLPKIQVSRGNHNGIIKYRDWDEATTVRAAAMVAEGAAFPESTAKFKDYTLPLQKIGDTLPVTEEFFEDEEQAASELALFLDTNVQTVIDNQLINGNGTGTNLKGLLSSVPAYTPTAQNIPGANIKDLAQRMRTGIVKTRGSKYSPDVLVANADTIDKYILAKDEDNGYLFDDNGRVGGLAIIEDNNMPDNQLVVGDSRYARIYEMGGVAISNGYVNAQYTEDEMTIKARKRLAMLIRTVDQTGFLKCTNINTALVTLATAP